MAKKQYRYKARDRNSIAISGQVEAENMKTVSHSLKELGYVVVSIEEVKQRFFNPVEFIKSHLYKVGSKDVILFLRQAAAMVNAGLPLLSALTNVIEQTSNLHFRRILINISSDIRAGKSLSDALSRHPQLFSDFYVNMIKAGEAGGMLGDVLERMAVISYEEQEMKGKLQGAFAYPVLLIVISVVIVTALLTFVLPKFIGIFQESGTRLPVTTTILLFISSTLRRFWFVPIIASAALFFYLRGKIRTEKGRYELHRRMLQVPILGRIILIVSVGRFCKIVGALVKSGVPLLNALNVSQGLLNNQVLINAIAHVRQAVAGGTSLAESLKLSGAFPQMMVQMVSVGESTGKLDEMFFQIADFYDKESNLAIRTITSLIEPILLLFMGLVVGFIALSVLLPIFNLVKVLKH